MVESNKILTVSYGTFSCTLEGFEDSFGTMKAIAEYFRDLAAEDRYFGAEPPTPDAEMLTRIAEREITRRVEARMESSGLVLRATGAIGQEAAPTRPAAATPAPVMPPAMPQRPAPVRPDPMIEAEATGDRADEMSDDSEIGSATGATAPAGGDIDGPGASVLAATGPAMAVAEVAQAPAPAPAPAGRTIRLYPADQSHPDADSVAAKLQRIRAVVGKTSTGDLAAASADYVEDLNLAPMGSEDSAEADLPSYSVDAEDDVLARLVADAPVVSEPEPDEVMVSDELDLSAYLTAPAAEAEIEAEIEDGHDAEIDAEIDADLNSDADPETAIEAEMAEIEAGFDAIAPRDAWSPAPGVDDQAGSQIAEIMPEPDMAAVMDADEDEDGDDIDVDPTPAPAPVRARVIRMKRADFDQAVSSGALYETEDLPDLPADNVAALDGIDDLERFSGYVAEDFALDTEDEADLMQELAEVEAELSLTRDSAAGTVALPDAEDEDVMDSVADLVAMDEADAFYADDEDDIAEDEPEAVAADLDEDDAETDEADAPAPLRSPGRAILEQQRSADDAGFDRILTETDAQLNEPESNRRRAAIAQLKAAVAATEAARRMGEAEDDDEEAENAFRDDLSQVVRPRRAATVPERRTERPRPAPLKLVASQRIDLAPAAGADGSEPAARPVMPVRPRRVAVEEPKVAASAAGSFAEFAEEMGAHDLGDLLEAAAAYTSFVEGLEDFSRPQLMKIVREASGDDFSREDGLRSFGTLLRQGRIEKVSNGRFQVSEQTRYRPEPRAARG